MKYKHKTSNHPNKLCQHQILCCHDECCSSYNVVASGRKHCKGYWTTAKPAPLIISWKQSSAPDPVQTTLAVTIRTMPPMQCCKA
eukprot:1159529-Pelagomonas_calceolata.AAC.8